jgi:hypothetical protein
MIGFVERHIQACSEDAGKIRAKRQREDMAKRTTEGGVFKSHLEKIRADNAMPAPPAYVPTPADPTRVSTYPRNKVAVRCNHIRKYADNLVQNKNNRETSSHGSQIHRPWYTTQTFSSVESE